MVNDRDELEQKLKERCPSYLIDHRSQRRMLLL